MWKKGTQNGESESRQRKRMEVKYDLNPGSRRAEAGLGGLGEWGCIAITCKFSSNYLRLFTGKYN